MNMLNDIQDDFAPSLPGFILYSLIGEGGMSRVWKAYDEKNKRIVALKILRPEMSENPEDVDLFIAEEKIMREIDHPGVVKSYSLEMHEGIFFYVMEYVDGYTFGELLRRKHKLSEHDCLLICESVAAALHFAWNDHGIVHCDIKPENIMINSAGDVKLTDLGLCHTFRFSANGRQEVPDHVMGTPAYISPEQVYGDVELDCRADIYCLAATLYHLSTGQILFEGLSYEDMLRAHCADDKKAKDPRAFSPELSESFCQLLEYMLIKDRELRVASWMDVEALCFQIEKGIAFKPRATPGVSSLELGNL